MPALANAQHEKFIQEIAKGSAKGEAYLAAGYNAKNLAVAAAAATRLLKDVKIQGRLAELQKMAQSQALLTLDAHMKRLEDLSKLAEQKGQMSAATTAEIKRGELMGYYVERRESTNTNYNISDKPLTEDEWTDTYSVGSSSGSTKGARRLSS